MPPRLNKRQLRELQELEELERSKASSTSALPTYDDIESEPESEEDVAPRSKPVTGFGALDIGDDEEDEDEQVDQVAAPTKAKKKNKKKKKKPTTTEPLPEPPTLDSPDRTEGSPAAAVETPARSPAKKNKKKAKPKKPVPAKPEPKVDDGLDEIDRALAELALKNGGQASENDTVALANQRIDPKWAAVKDVYAFETKYLDSDAELRRMFGSKVIGNAPTAPRSHLHARFANNPHHSTSIRRSASHLATPEPGWPSASGTLALTSYEGPEAESDPSGDWHTFVHPPSYKQAQLMFLEVLQQADGNRLFDVLAAQPYHIDTLMQLSEMMAQQGDLGASATHLSRALYALSGPLPATFPSGTFRLPYSQVENRAFFLGIARQVAILVKRGTWRTAFEFAKIALGTGGGDDPVGMLCWIDFLAPKAGQNEWFLKFVPTLAEAYPDMRITCYPGLAFAKALVLRNLEEEKKENNDKSTAALTSAILRFPVVATLLSNSLAFDLPPALVSHRRAQPDGSFTNNPSYLVSLLSELYVARSAPLWKDPASLAWLRKTIIAATPSIDDQSLEDVQFGERVWEEGPWGARGVAPAGVIRAAFVSDLPSIRPYLPPATRSGTTYSFDPVPPTNSNATFYNDEYFSSLYSTTTTRRRRTQQQQQQQQQRGGGGGDVAAAMRDGLARMLGIGQGAGAVDLTPELREELMRELEMLGGAQGGMPGGFGNQDDEEEEEGEDEEGYEDEQDEDGQERIDQTRNLLGRLGALFGAGGAAP
ncbi:transcriptional repressor TCF25 family protein [Sporobolomyces koalae]|uniref:transcriptional repressor TCF25 family protein n=1 Tax=Sporobolomyces koalae TaxID=500713 RepID=UPI00317595A5